MLIMPLVGYFGRAFERSGVANESVRYLLLVISPSRLRNNLLTRIYFLFYTQLTFQGLALLKSMSEAASSPRSVSSSAPSSTSGPRSSGRRSHQTFTEVPVLDILQSAFPCCPKCVHKCTDDRLTRISLPASHSASIDGCRSPCALWK